ncbi:hypothetical protein CYY_000543 [Polysphondylium violaceum]|uniref:RING-type domain-containing protein n=1 Tax=Polysphondylium violaceum TaxID=133409 RepID=A0A8J4Q4M6_9MYCE|nr:hypothetical protein CYY_000543 [Polysphondylium violaceum]
MSDLECSICCLEFSTNGELRPHRLPCSHIFHKSCVYEWVRDKKNCPICRKEFTNSKVDDILCYDHVISSLIAKIQEITLKSTPPTTPIKSDSLNEQPIKKDIDNNNNSTIISMGNSSSSSSNIDDNSNSNISSTFSIQSILNNNSNNKENYSDINNNQERIDPNNDIDNSNNIIDNSNLEKSNVKDVLNDYYNYNYTMGNDSKMYFRFNLDTQQQQQQQPVDIKPNSIKGLNASIQKYMNTTITNPVIVSTPVSESTTLQQQFDSTSKTTVSTFPNMTITTSPANRSINSHKHSFIKRPISHYDQWVCHVCTAFGKGLSEKYNCQDCGLDVCRFCAIEKQFETSPKAQSNGPFYSSLHPDPLYFMNGLEVYGQRAYCNACSAQSTDIYHCTTCKVYDLCSNCMDKTKKRSTLSNNNNEISHRHHHHQHIDSTPFDMKNSRSLPTELTIERSKFIKVESPFQIYDEISWNCNWCHQKFSESLIVFYHSDPYRDLCLACFYKYYAN